MTPGQELALHQAKRVAAERSGAISVVQIEAAGRYLRITISIDCRGFRYDPPGVRLRERERFHVWVPPTFPFKPPTVRTPHNRWGLVQHVQWSNYLCLYQAVEAEWDPSDGMFGFLDRLLEWLTAASRGQLDAVGGPIHPPVIYPADDCPMIIPRVDSPARSDHDWWGFARMRPFGDHRRDIIGWCDIDEASGACDRGEVAAPAILLSNALPWEYPTSFLCLLLALIQRGVSTSTLFRVLRLGQLLCDDKYVYVVVGTPMRGTVGGEIRQHLAVWRFRATEVSAFYKTVPREGDSAETEAQRDRLFSRLISWASECKVKVEWCPVREARPEVTRPRDEGSPMSKWAGRRVAIWGCGALGSSIAEHLARAGVRSLVLRDNSNVAPGVLVRQNYQDSDLGVAKVTALAERLRGIVPELSISTETAELTADLGRNWDDKADVVFDLTASPAVAQRLELSRMQHSSKATVVGMTISHDASHGLVVTSLPNASGGPVDVRRKAKIVAARSPDLAYLAEEFWPTDPTRTTSFVPEPGCSSPTFIGSDAEVAALAASMLLLASTVDEHPHDMTGAFVSLPTDATDGLTRRITFPNDIVTADPINGHQIRVAPEAIAEMRAWARRSHRCAPLDETGGYLFGQRDDALGVVWVTDVLGPPPDSRASPMLFVCGVDGVAEAAVVIRRRSRDASRPIGMWHTHPNSWPFPSDTDHDGMTQIITDPETASPKQVLLILGCHPDRPFLAAYVYERHKDNALLHPLPLYRVPNEPARDHRIGLALSGGGLRAVAFHLGVLRALHDRGVLDRIEVISSVSGGAIISAMWAYGPEEEFPEFDSRVTILLQNGLNRKIAAATLATYRAPLQLLTFVAAGVASVGRFGSKGFRRVTGRSNVDRGPWFRRTLTLTSAVQRVLRSEIGDATLDKPSKPVRVIINACDLRTGTAFRFGSTESGSTKYGTLVSNKVPVAFAAATSAAYPVILPAVDTQWEFQDRNGTQSSERVILTDGGVYDNLGTTCLEPGRDAAFSTNVHPVDYIISADAGPGALDTTAYPVWWPGRMKRSFESVYRKVQDGGKGSLFEHGNSGALKGFVMPFLGQQDGALPIKPSNLVRREDVIGYPTSFSKVKPADLARLTARGEQLTRLMIEHHCPEIA